jgi:hypothetical protein
LLSLQANNFPTSDQRASDSTCRQYRSTWHVRLWLSFSPHSFLASSSRMMSVLKKCECARELTLTLTLTLTHTHTHTHTHARARTRTGGRTHAHTYSFHRYLNLLFLSTRCVAGGLLLVRIRRCVCAHVYAPLPLTVCVCVRVRVRVRVFVCSARDCDKLQRRKVTPWVCCCGSAWAVAVPRHLAPRQES